MKVFDLAALQEYGELMYHIVSDSSNYTISVFNDELLIIENDTFQYTIPKNLSGQIIFFRENPDTGETKYSISDTVALYQ